MILGSCSVWGEVCTERLAVSDGGLIVERSSCWARPGTCARQGQGVILGSCSVWGEVCTERLAVSDGGLIVERHQSNNEKSVSLNQEEDVCAGRRVRGGGKGGRPKQVSGRRVGSIIALHLPLSDFPGIEMKNVDVPKCVSLPCGSEALRGASSYLVGVGGGRPMGGGGG